MDAYRELHFNGALVYKTVTQSNTHLFIGTHVKITPQQHKWKRQHAKKNTHIIWYIAVRSSIVVFQVPTAGQASHKTKEKSNEF